MAAAAAWRRQGKAEVWAKQVKITDEHGPYTWTFQISRRPDESPQAGWPPKLTPYYQIMAWGPDHAIGTVSGSTRLAGWQFPTTPEKAMHYGDQEIERLKAAASERRGGGGGGRTRNPGLEATGELAGPVGRRQRAQLMRELAAAQKDEHQAELKKLDAQIKEARGARKAKLEAARAQCKASFAKVRAEADAQWQAERQGALERRRARKVGARKCGAAKQVRDETNATIRRAQQSKRQARQLRREVLAADRRTKRKERTRATVKERRAESDEAVEREIPPHLVPLWHQVKGSIKGSAHQSRAEAFLKYAEENETDAIGALEESFSDDDFARQEREAWERMQNPLSEGFSHELPKGERRAHFYRRGHAICDHHKTHRGKLEPPSFQSVSDCGRCWRWVRALQKGRARVSRRKGPTASRRRAR